MPDYSIRVFQISEMLKMYMPDLYNHFKVNNLPFDMILQKWIMTLFSNYLNIDKLLVVWYYFFMDGWEALIKFSIIILEQAKDRLMECDLEGVSGFTKDKDWIESMSTKQFYCLFHSHNEKYRLSNPITNELLEELKDQFYIDLLSKKLTVKKENEWQQDQISAIKEYNKESRRLNEINKKRIKEYQNEIEETRKEFKELSQLYLEGLNKFNNDKSQLILEVEEISGLEFVVKNLEENLQGNESTNNVSKLKSSDDANIKFNSKSTIFSKISKLNPFSYFSASTPSNQSNNAVVKEELVKFKSRLFLLKDDSELINAQLSKDVSVILMRLCPFLLV